ncbi:hypothetical protein KFL_009740040 [Klebsormidium nitens]|uniref:Uncharacterized protein n=1 Tax=Klebsormidium nitens TaxID=105231 RepID=A0A1Y1IN48_KLENI|nr:hypothetical protein KFL_009740040 [Klebsormidium nitens]|eukprot:GAQ92310.1 hypothetical protein KFL_009740040 [Klebsormidium nitens]
MFLLWHEKLVRPNLANYYKEIVSYDGQKVAWDVSYTAANGVMIKLDGAVVEETTAEGAIVCNHGAVSSVPAAFVTVTGAAGLALESPILVPHGSHQALESVITKVLRYRAETQGPSAPPPLLVTDSIKRDHVFIRRLLKEIFPTISEADFVVAEIIKHREWAFSRKLEKGHGDYSAVKYDLELCFSGRLSRPDPTSASPRPTLGDSDLRPLSPENVVVEAPSTCRSPVEIAAVLERAFQGESLHTSELRFSTALIHSGRMEVSTAWRCALATLRRLCVKLRLKPSDVDAYYPVVGYSCQADLVYNVAAVLAFYSKARASSSTAFQSVAARLGVLYSGEQLRPEPPLSASSSRRVMGAAEAMANAARGICDRMEIDHAFKNFAEPLVLNALLANQKLFRFFRDTIANESLHSVINSKDAGKGWKSFELAQARLDTVAIAVNSGILAQLVGHWGTKYSHGDRALVALATSLRQATRELLKRASQGGLAVRCDYMLVMKGVFPARVGLSDLLQLGYRLRAMQHSRWTEEEGVVPGCLKQYAKDPSVVGEWGSVARWISEGHVRSRDIKAVYRRICELGVRDLGIGAVNEQIVEEGTQEELHTDDETCGEDVQSDGLLPTAGGGAAPKSEAEVQHTERGQFEGPTIVASTARYGRAVTRIAL